MNADHQDSVGRIYWEDLKCNNNQQAIRFLEHYCHLPSFSARNARFVEINQFEITMSSGSNLYHIALEPPMQTLMETRARLVYLDQKAIDAKGRSTVTVKEYRGPSTLFEIFIFTACVFTLTVLSRKQNVTSGSWLHDVMLFHAPGFAHVPEKMQSIFWPMLCIHCAEAVFMATVKLNRHTVPVGSSLWWKWVISTFIDGLFSFRR